MTQSNTSDGTQSDAYEPGSADTAVLKKKARRNILRYTLARLGLFVLLTIVIQGISWLIDAPLLLPMSAALALLVAWPLSMFVFSGLRVQATAALENLHQQRRAEKEWVRSTLNQRN